MYIVRNGIDVPDDLVRAHEEGRVVFFCGAGISYEAGFSDFKELTESVFSKVCETPNAAEKTAAKFERWDAVLGSLENRIADPSQVRKKIFEILQPDPGKDITLATHQAILDLSVTRDAEPCMQLVTTNFDRMFERLIDAEYPWAQRYSAPMMPTPRKGLWNGIGYIHGLLPEKYDQLALSNLVVTSGDFGRAYLAEAWAARFVSELMRNYVVCFVGYSLGDQTVRYLMDAADVYNRIGDKTEKVYMFTPSGGPDVIEQNRSIVRIVYDKKADGGNHAMLHRTLQAWAKRYKNGLDGKYEIIRDVSKINPAEIPDDGYVDQLMWAISDDKEKTYKPLKYFANLSECPNLGWLSVFESYKDKKYLDGNLFSADDGGEKAAYLSSWILRRMSTKEVVLWTVKNQWRLCRRFFSLAAMICDGCKIGAEQIVLDDFTKRVWRIIVAGKTNVADVYLLHRDVDFADWIFKDHLDCLKKDLIRKALTPKIKLSGGYVFRDTNREGLKDGKLSDLLCAGLTFAGEEYDHIVKDIHEKMAGRLHCILRDASTALETSLDLLDYLRGFETNELDVSIEIPSIERHWQNDSKHNELIYLAGIIRDGWKELLAEDRVLAGKIAVDWLDSRHFILKRFGLFAAKETDLVSPKIWLRKLIENHGYILWSLPLKREVMRLVFTKAKALSSDQLKQLTAAILRGSPPCQLLRGLSNPEAAADLDDRDKFVFLLKIKNEVHRLPENCEAELTRLKGKYPQWKLGEDDSDEFYSWHMWSGDPSEDKHRHNVSVPKEKQALAEWIEKDIGRDEFARRYEVDDFKPQCSKKQKLVIEAFTQLAEKGIWNIARLDEALGEWKTEKLASVAAKFLICNLKGLKKHDFELVANAAVAWAEGIGKPTLIAEDDLVAIGRMILNHDFGSAGMRFGKEKDLVFCAINHTVGRMTSALICKCFPGQIHKGDKIQGKYKALFELASGSANKSAKFARLILASRAIAFYYADEKWTRKYILPYSSWKRPGNAVYFWQGFLWQHSLHIPLLSDIKKDFLETARHCDKLGESAKSYIALFISLALRHQGDFPDKEMAEIIRAMPVEQLEWSAAVIEDHMTKVAEADGDCDHAWNEDCWPVIQNMWPKDKAVLTDKIQNCLTVALLKTKTVLSDGLHDIWFILPVANDAEHAVGGFLWKCAECDSLEHYPRVCLEILSRRVNTVSYWDSPDLKKCLDRLENGDFEIVKDEKFIRLRRILDDIK